MKLKTRPWNDFTRKVTMAGLVGVPLATAIVFFAQMLGVEVTPEDAATVERVMVALFGALGAVVSTVVAYLFRDEQE